MECSQPRSEATPGGTVNLDGEMLTSCLSAKQGNLAAAAQRNCILPWLRREGEDVAAAAAAGATVVVVVVGEFGMKWVCQ